MIGIKKIASQGIYEAIPLSFQERKEKSSHFSQIQIMWIWDYWQEKQGAVNLPLEKSV
jgi:hypothetical protein